MKRTFTLLIAAVVLISSVGGVALAATQADTSPGDLNPDATAVPNAQIDVDVTKDVHEVGWNPTNYEANDGSESDLEATVNSSVENPVSFVPTDIEESDFSQFPRKDAEVGNNSASALDASEWTSDLAGSAGSGSVSDVQTAPGVDALQMTTSSQTSGDVAVFTYSNFSITSDEPKRYLQLGADVSALDSGAGVEIRVTDADGDYKVVHVNSSMDASASDVLANATGEGKILQEQLGTLSTLGSGDGTFNDIESIEIRVSDADATLEVALVNAEKLGMYKFGEQKYDEDDDGTLDETQTLYEPRGEISLTAVDTLGSTFEDAAVHDVTYPMQFRAQDLVDPMDAHYNVSKASAYPSFESLADVYYRLQLPDQYDISYSNAELTGTQEMPDTRYQSVEIAEGVGDTVFADIGSWSDTTSTYSATGEHTLDSTIQPGSQIGLHFETLWTAEDESNAIVSGAAGQFADDSGGFLGFLFSVPGMIIGSIASALGIRSIRG